jgi:hypothetical protein
VKIQFVKPGGGSGFRFFQKWVWWQNISRKLGTRDGKLRYLPGATKNEHVQTSCGAGARFFKMCAAANLSDQLLNMRRESEVMARMLGKSHLSWQACAPGLFFSKTDPVTILLGQVFDSRWESEALAVACENSVCQAEGRIRLSFFSEMGGVAKILAQAWDSTWKSEVPARGYQK